jgi:hypothetical protein
MPKVKPTTAVKIAALITFIVGLPHPSLACSAEGPAIHVGRLLSLDKSAGTFTLLDTETMRPVTLAADVGLLDRVSSMLYHAYQNDSGGVVVTYEQNGNTLRALALE